MDSRRFRVVRPAQHGAVGVNLAAALESPYPRPTTRCPPIGIERCLGLRRCSSGIHVIGAYVMDSKNRIGRRERFEILKIVQGLGDGVADEDYVPAPGMKQRICVVP